MSYNLCRACLSKRYVPFLCSPLSECRKLHFDKYPLVTAKHSDYLLFNSKKGSGYNSERYSAITVK
jgi:hypothetical protein